MKEYKIIENPPNKEAAEIILNDFAVKGWKVVGFSSYQICMERDKQNTLNEGTD